MLDHITGWDDAVIASIKSFLAGEVPATPASRGIDAYNAETVTSREAIPYEVTQRIDHPGADDFFLIGVDMAVGRLLSMPDDSSSALVQGRRRVEVVEFTQLEPFLVARARPICETMDVDRQTDATMRTRSRCSTTVSSSIVACLRKPIYMP